MKEDQPHLPLQSTLMSNSDPYSHLNPNPYSTTNNPSPEIQTMSASTNITLNERNVEDQSLPPMPPPSVRAAKSIGSLLMVFFILQTILNYFVLRFLLDIAQSVQGGRELGGVVCAGVGENGINGTGGAGVGWNGSWSGV